MASINFPIATILFFLLPAIAVAIKVPRPHTEVSDFVSQSCKLTKYPDLCIKTLSPFAKSIKQDDLSAVLLNSLDATLSAAKHSRKRLSGFYIDSNATKPEPGSTKLDGVLKFCVDSHVDAVGQLERAINIVKNIGSVNEEVLGFSFAGADYDLALCLTDMNECIDHWKVIPNGYVKTEIFRSSEKVRKHVVISRDILKKFQFVMDSKINHKVCKMSRTRTNRNKIPEGWELIEPTLLNLKSRMREAENDPNDGKRNCEALWPIIKIAHQRSRYIYDLHQKGEISDELYEYCLDKREADRNLIAKWKKAGYERLCCLQCMQTRDHNFGSTCVCRVPKQMREESRVIECVHCGCRGCASGDN